MVAQLRDGGREVEEYLASGAALELIGTGNELCSSLRDVLAGLLPGLEAQVAKERPSQASRMPGRRRGRHVGKRKGWGK